MPLVHSKQPVSGDCDHSRRHQTRLGVGCHVSDRGVGGELEDHDDILLGLVCEHQWALQEEILLSGHDKTQTYKKEKTTENEKRKGAGKEEETVLPQLRVKAERADRLLETALRICLFSCMSSVELFGD